MYKINYLPLLMHIIMLKVRNFLHTILIEYYLRFFKIDSLEDKQFIFRFYCLILERYNKLHWLYLLPGVDVQRLRWKHSYWESGILKARWCHSVHRASLQHASWDLNKIVFNNLIIVLLFRIYTENVDGMYITVMGIRLFSRKRILTHI